jgi:hypothetical protein
MNNNIELTTSENEILKNTSMPIDTGKNLNNMDKDFSVDPLENMKERLKKQLYEYKKTSFTRYFINHRWRIAFIVLCIILLIVCIFTGFPINGDIDTTNNGSKFMSLLGYTSANIFIVLLVTVLGIETLLSRTESEQLKKDSARIGNDLTDNNKNNPNRLKKILQALQVIKNNKNIISRKIFVDSVKSKYSTNKFSGQNESTTELYNQVKKEINELSLDDMPELIEQL